MTPYRLVIPRACPTSVPGPALVPEPAASPANVLSFPAATAPAVTQAVSRTTLLAEYLVIFGALPLILSLHAFAALPRLPVLWIAAACCGWVLGRDPTFHRRELWDPEPLRSHLPQLLALFAAGVVVVSVLMHLYLPSLFLTLPRLHPRVWALVMVTYPVASV